MSLLSDRTEKVAIEVFMKQWAARQPLAAKAQTNNTGLAKVSKLNSDGTIDVKLNGQTITGVSPGSSPRGVGQSVQVVNGQQVVG